MEQSSSLPQLLENFGVTSDQLSQVRYTESGPSELGPMLAMAFGMILPIALVGVLIFVALRGLKRSSAGKRFRAWSSSARFPAKLQPAVDQNGLALAASFVGPIGTLGVLTISLVRATWTIGLRTNTTMTIAWHGSGLEKECLIQAVAHNCGCEFGVSGVRISTCGAHQILVDQRTLNGLLFVRYLATRPFREEMRIQVEGRRTRSAFSRRCALHLATDDSHHTLN